MKPFSDDTDVVAHRVQVTLLRALGPAERLAMVVRLNEAADAMALARLAADYPDDTPRMRRLRLQSLKYGADVMRAAFQWDPESRGW